MTSTWYWIITGVLVLFFWPIGLAMVAYGIVLNNRKKAGM